MSDNPDVPGDPKPEGMSLKEFVETQLPGYDELFESLNDTDTSDKATEVLLTVLWEMGGMHPVAGMIIKTAYVLGLYNERRGLHYTKH